MLKKEITFADFGLKTPILHALTDLGYKTPSPIQAACIPDLLIGRDVLGMAQTGSGKTAAFCLPLLNNIKIELLAPQILVLTPTRELAVQVGEVCAYFVKYIKNVNTVTIYGGQRYNIQLQALRRGPQIIISTPGRLLDHLKQGTINLSNLSGLVLDEADEMLRMGFIEDVENILKQIPTKHQTALFSATMPKAIRCITHRFMNNPKEIRIQSNFTTRPDIKQSYWAVYGVRKDEALIRFLESEDFDAAIIFVRTKHATLEVAKALEYSGFNSAALNGDMNQTLREQTLDRLKKGHLDILIATDVAARGLDVDRISLVINYDIPMDSESYVHRIGRTGRAGRAGRALMFVENKERRLLHNIERIMKCNIPEIKLPTSETLSARRLSEFTKKVQKYLKNSDLNMYKKLLLKLKNSNNLDIETLASVLLKIASAERPLIIKAEPIIEHRKGYIRQLRNNFNTNKMHLYRIEVGRNDGVEIRHIVGAIANEGNINSHYIGNIKLFASYSTVELKNISCDRLSQLMNIHIFNKPINIQFIKEVDARREHHKLIREKNYTIRRSIISPAKHQND